MFFLYKYSCIVILDLGLVILRGWGKCKNFFCSYVYINRYKFWICFSCGFNFVKDWIEKNIKVIEVSLLFLDVLNVIEFLSIVQREIQCQFILQLLCKVLQIFENELELVEVFVLIYEFNSF